MILIQKGWLTKTLVESEADIKFLKGKKPPRYPHLASSEIQLAEVGGGTASPTSSPI